MKFFAVLVIVSAFALCKAQDEAVPAVTEVENAPVPEEPTTASVVEESANEEQDPAPVPEETHEEDPAPVPEETHEEDPAPVPEETHEEDPAPQVETTTAANAVSKGPNAEDKCPNGRFERDANDCSVYYICLKTSGLKIKMHCARFFHFDTESKSCRYRAVVKC